MDSITEVSRNVNRMHDLASAFLRPTTDLMPIDGMPRVANATPCAGCGRWSQRPHMVAYCSQCRVEGMTREAGNPVDLDGEDSNYIRGFESALLDIPRVVMCGREENAGWMAGYEWLIDTTRKAVA